MTEFSNRILTSFLLIFLFSMSYFNSFILFIVLLLCLIQIFYEFFNILEKIISKKLNYLLYFFLLSLLCLTTLIICYVGITISGDNFSDKIFLLLIITITISTDVGGFFFGKILKGKKITKVSPNKTYSGMIGSYLLSIIFSYVLFKNYFDNFSMILIIIIVSTVSQLGDLFISFLKRKAKLKNTGDILPGHGGLLDRFDGLIFALFVGLLIKNLL